MYRLAFAAAASAICLAAPAFADGFQRVSDGRDFVSLVKDKELRRFGIRLQVSDGGQITGKAFGQDVTGAWRWEDGFFCRDLYVGGDELGANCQLVQVRGDTMRFTSDKGAGIYADLKLD